MFYNFATEKLIIQQTFTNMKKLVQKTLILALLSVVGINANAATRTIFSASVNQTGVSEVKKATTTEWFNCSSNSTLFSGCNLYFYNSNANEQYYLRKPHNSTSDFWYCITNNNVVYKIELPGAIKVNDVISADILGNNSSSTEEGICFQSTEVTTRPGTLSTAYISTNVTKDHQTATYTVKETDTDLIGKTTLYLYRKTTTGTYFNNLTITREVAGGTAIELTTSSAAIYALNSTTPEGKLPTETGTSSATWEGTSYSFSLTGATSSEYLRDLNSTKAERQIVINETSYRPIMINKGTNGVYNITKSDNVKSVTLYAKYNATSGTAGTIIFDYGIDGKQTASTTLPLLEETAAEFDVTDKTNIRVSGSTAIAFAIEYESGASVTVADINWASLYLPVAVTIPEGVKAYYASNVSSSSVTLTEITDAIPANTGVVINAEADTYSFPIATTEVAALGDGVNKFDGVAADTPCDARTAYVLSGANEAKTAPKFGLYTGTTLGAYKAYIDKEANNLSDALTLNFVIGEPTAIDSIEAATPATQVRKYILNGAVIVEKNGKKYNAAGAQVK